jgi:uridine phosphorylase
MPNYEDLVAAPVRTLIEAELSDPVLLMLVAQHLTIAAELLRAKRQARPLMPVKVYSIKRDQHHVSMIGPALGAPAAVMALERCAAQGVRRVVVVGVAGSLRAEVKTGDFLVPTSAKSEEGTSRFYEPDKFPPLAGERALAAVEDTMKNACLDYHRGPVWTMDAFYRETKDKVKRYGDEGIMAVEMELAALFTVARFRGMELAGLLVISDELASLTWKNGMFTPTFLNSLRLSCTLGLNAALRLASA